MKNLYYVLIQKPGTNINKLRFGENELKFMDESSAVTLPSPLDVLDNSIANDNSSGISISDFRMEFKDLAELGKINSLDVGCQQEALEPSNASENEDCTANSPLLEPLLRNHLISNEGSSNLRYTQSRPYLYGKQLHSLKQNDISASPKLELMHSRNIRAPSTSPSTYHHAHYEHHHNFKKNCLNDMNQKQLIISETSKCNNFPTIPIDYVKTSKLPDGRALTNYRCHRQKCSSIDGSLRFISNIYFIYHEYYFSISIQF